MKDIENEKIYSVYMHILPKEISGKNNDMIYIGITSRKPEIRWGYNGYGYRKQPHFYNAIKKYGFDNFRHEVLFIALTKEEAEEKEVELIAKYQSNNRKFGYNIANGGNASGTMAQETKDKIAKAHIGNQYSLGHKHTEETKRKMSEAAKGNQRSKGKKMPEHVMRMLLESRQNEEVRRKISNALTGKKQSEEHRRKNSESHKGIGAKKVVCIETGIVYESVKEAGNMNNIKGHGHISACCIGGRETCGGYHWCYEEDYTEEKVKELLSPKINKHCIAILCVETNKKYDSIKDAAADIGISKTGITEYFKGRQSYAGKLPDGTKLHWEYVS